MQRGRAKFYSRRNRMRFSLIFLLVGAIFDLAIASRNIVLPRADVTVPLASKRVKKGARVRRRVGNRYRNTDVLALDGAAFESEYLVNVTVGGQNFQVILDTGSSDFWVAHKDFSCFALNDTAIPASACDFGPAQFDPALSPTFQPLPNTTFFVRYGSGEFLAGLTGFDTLTIGDVSVTQQEFGIPDQNAFLGDGVSEGVLGLAFPGLTSVYNVSDRHQAAGVNHIVYDPFFVNAVKQGKVKNPYFSHSLDRPTLEEQENDPFVSKLGFFSLGGIVPVPTKAESTVTLPVIGYAPDANGFFVPSLNTSQPHYRLLWYSIIVDGYVFPASQNLTTASNSTFFDSGTTLNLLPSPIAAAYNAPWAVFNEELGLYVVDCATKSPPAFSVLLAGKEFTIDGRDMVVPQADLKDASGNVVCISGIQDNGPVEEGSTFILGDVFLHNVVVTHNVVDAEVYVTQREPY
ncbi:acid protease [Mycena amicta]|nr:acid protease [Mycena amicta]